jgi:hypothetical protein
MPHFFMWNLAIVGDKIAIQMLGWPIHVGWGHFE